MTHHIQFSEPFETILNLLAIAVLVDQQERDKELVELYHCAHLHNQQLQPDNILTPDQVNDWYHHHKSYLSSRLRSETSEQFMTDMLMKIGDKGLQRAVLISMFNISVADYELAELETEFLHLALKVWDSPLPNSSEVHVYT